MTQQIDKDLEGLTISLNAALEHCPQHTSAIIKAACEPILIKINDRLLKEAQPCPAQTANA